MTDKNNLEEKLENLGQAIGSDGSIVENVMSRIDESNRIGKSKNKLLTRKPIMNRFTKLAAAAVIIVAVLLTLKYFTGSINATSAAFAQVKEAINEVNWLHCINKASSGETEEWYSFESQIKILKEDTGKVTCYNYREKREHVYDPSTRTVTVSYLPGDPFAFGTASPLALVEKLIQKEQERGAELIRKTGEYNQTEVESWEVMRAEENGIERIKLFIGIKRHLPIAAEVKYINLNGKIIYEGNVKFEYPENGPANIYELGVPKSATVVDKGPQ